MSNEVPYVFQSFPKYLFRVEGGEVKLSMVNSAEELINLGDGWYESPDEAYAGARKAIADAEAALLAEQGEGSEKILEPADSGEPGTPDPVVLADPEAADRPAKGKARK